MKKEATYFLRLVLASTLVLVLPALAGASEQQDNSLKCPNLTGTYFSPDKDDPYYEEGNPLNGRLDIEIVQNNCSEVTILAGLGNHAATGWVVGTFAIGVFDIRNIGANNPNFRTMSETLVTFEGDGLKVVQASKRSVGGQPFQIFSQSEQLLRLNENGDLHQKLEMTDNVRKQKIIRERDVARVSNAKR